ncbi:MAG: phospholipase A2 [Candidatus Aminicenantes bacterium]|jgi:hypothetical protein
MKKKRSFIRSKTIVFVITIIFLFSFDVPQIVAKEKDEPNGCGTKKIDVPDKPFGNDFKEACNNHDKCYSTQGKSKKNCDDQFRKDMDRECNKKKGIGHKVCKATSSVYHNAVKYGGNGAYNRAQGNSKVTPSKPKVPKKERKSSRSER